MLTIGEAAQRLAVSADSLRYYESKGYSRLRSARLPVTGFTIRLRCGV